MSDEPKSVPSVGRAFLAGAWSGVKFGAKAGVGLYFLICLVWSAILIVSPAARAEDFGPDFDPLRFIGRLMIAIAGMAAIGAAPGAVIMGLFGVLNRKAG